MIVDRWPRRAVIAGAAALAAARGRAQAWPAPSAAPIPPAIRQLYARAIVIDALASPTSWNVPYPPPGPLTAAQLDNARASGITAINLTVGGPGTLADTVRELGFWMGEIARHPDRLMLVRGVADIAAAKASRRLGVILGFQGLNLMAGDVRLVDSFADLSVRIMQLTYNDRNPFGAGSSLPESEGLTPLGREAIARMNARGVLVDVGHANATTAIDAAHASTRPITASHTGARAIFASQRNLPDAALRAVAERGGVVGVYLMPFLGRDPVAPSAALFQRHLAHVLDVCGEDHVGIGSDQSLTPIDLSPGYMAAVRTIAETRAKAGIGAPGEADAPVTVPELNSAHRIELIAAAMARTGYPARVIEKVIGANFARLFKAVWPG